MHGSISAALASVLRVQHCEENHYGLAFWYFVNREGFVDVFGEEDEGWTKWKDRKVVLDYDAVLACALSKLF